MNQQRHGFTLVEMLVVLFIFLLLASVALPITKKLISDEKTTRAAQSIESFISTARNRAIAEGRTHGVRLERLGDLDSLRSTSIQMRYLKGAPDYTGDAADATAIVSASTSTSGIDTLAFTVADSPLLYLSLKMLQSADPREKARSPIQYGDLIELPGGFLAPIEQGQITGDATTVFVKILPRNNVLDASGAATSLGRFPDTLRDPVTGSSNQVKYRIHRRPTPTTSGIISLPRGLAIDLNYSGIGLGGNEFAPTTLAADIPQSVDILFNGNGAVSEVILGNTRFQPQGRLFFLVGRIDGIADVEGAMTSDREDLFSNVKPLIANIMDRQSIWLVVNAASGQVDAVANQPVTTIPTERTDARPSMAPAPAELSTALKESRVFATFSDSVEG